MLKLITLSDVHNQIDRVKLQNADLLCIAGDLTGKGTIKEFIKFNQDIGEIKANYHFKYGIMIIFGNHDFLSEADMGFAKSLLPNVDYILQDSGVEIDGVSFWGSAWSCRFFDWAWNVDRGAAIKAKWDLIPQNTDILITHGPPRGFGDRTLGYRGGQPENVGCDDLLAAIQEKKIKLSLCGHIHSGYGFIKTPNHLYINASTCNEKYQPVNPPIIIDVDLSKPSHEWAVEYYKPEMK